MDVNIKVQEKDVGYLKSKDASIMHKVVKNPSATIGQNSATTSSHRSLKRRLEPEFDTFAYKLGDDLDAALQKRIDEKYGISASPQASGVKIYVNCSRKAEIDVAVRKSPVSTKTTIKLAAKIKTENDIEQKLKSAEIIDLTHDNEDLEISPTQLGTISQSVDATDITKMEKNIEVTSKEFIDLTIVEEEIEVKSVENSDEIEVWEVVDLSA